MRIIVGIVLLFAASVRGGGVVQQQDTLPSYVLGGDTFLVKELAEIDVVAKPRTAFRNGRERRYYGRLLRDVKKTLPYAKIAAAVMVEVNDSLQSLTTKKEQNAFIKEKEEQLFAEYEPILRKMTIRQGRMLIKLIDRECQITSYEVVRIYRGGFSAFFWQGIARIFGTNLKSRYDPAGEDALVEEVVLLIEAGAV